MISDAEFKYMNWCFFFYLLNINYFQILEEAAESVVNPELAVKYSLPVNDCDNCLLIEIESDSYSE